MTDADFRGLIDEIKQRVTIADVIGACISLDHNLKALCPFHDDRNPSLSVNATGQYFYCFGCGAGGDVFTFLELYEGKPFGLVLSELAERAGIAIPSSRPGILEQITESRSIEDVLSETARFYHGGLTPAAMKYLTTERGFSRDTIKHFRIGYANGGLCQDLTENCGYELEICLKAGVLKRDKDGHVRDYFRDRLIFPNLRRGRVVHISGRCLDGREPKYLHLPGPIAHLYNEDALLSTEVILTEGPTDCISAAQAGYPAVAILGLGNLKPEYLERLSRCQTAYICFDGDKAGREGALRIAGAIGGRARIVALPDGVDLNDYFKEHSTEEFHRLLETAQDYIEYEIALIPADTPKTALPGRLEPILRKLACIDKARSEAYLSYTIKPHFKLKREDIDGYRDLVNQYRDNAQSDRKQSEDESREAFTAVFDGLVDLVEHDGQPAFLVKGNEGLSIETEVILEGQIYRPPPRHQIPWLLPRGEEVLAVAELEGEIPTAVLGEALYDDLLAYHKAISDLPGEQYYDLIVAWVLHTYLMKTVQYTPIICLFAIPERGKSRTGKGMIYVAYRGIHVESLRDSYIVRVAQNLNASLFFDVKDIWRKAEKNGSEDILLHRFEKGARVPRVLYPDRGPHKDIVYYSIFGPTVIATNEGVHRILETRAVAINMPEASRRFENDVTPEIALPLKERLVVFRARHLGKALPDVAKPAAGRLGDILRPLLQMIRLVKPEREAAFLALVKDLEEKRQMEKIDSLEAQILEVLAGLRDKVELGALRVKLITDTLNEDRPERARLSYQRVGRRLSAMGFDKTRASDGASAVLWDEEKVCRMIEVYGLGKTSEMSERSETPVLEPDVSDVSGETDVSRNACEEVPQHGYPDAQG